MTQARPVSDIWNFSYQSWEIDVLYPPGATKAGRLWCWSCQRPRSPPSRERPSVRGRNDSNKQRAAERREREKPDSVCMSKSSPCWGQLRSVLSMVWLREPIHTLFMLKVVRVEFLSLQTKSLWLTQIFSVIAKMRSLQKASRQQMFTGRSWDKRGRATERLHIGNTFWGLLGRHIPLLNSFHTHTHTHKDTPGIKGKRPWGKDSYNTTLLSQVLFFFSTVFFRFIYIQFL